VRWGAARYERMQYILYICVCVHVQTMQDTYISLQTVCVCGGGLGLNTAMSAIVIVYIVHMMQPQHGHKADRDQDCDELYFRKRACVTGMHALMRPSCGREKRESRRPETTAAGGRCLGSRHHAKLPALPRSCPLATPHVMDFSLPRPMLRRPVSRQANRAGQPSCRRWIRRFDSRLFLL